MKKNSLSKFNHECQFTIKNIQINLNKWCKNKRSLINQMNINIISQMNNNVFLVPKKLLSFYVKQIFQAGFYYISEYSMKKIIDDVYQSENFDILKINLQKLQSVKDKNFLMVCLPYDLQIWKKQLKNYFTQTAIQKTFKKFNNENGSYRSSSDAYLIIINSDVLSCLKDIEQVVEHQFVHMFQDINHCKNKISFNLLKILKDPDQYHTYVINLINRLFKIYDRYCIINQKTDSVNVRKIFLDKVFKLAKDCSSPNLLYFKMKYYCSGSLMESNMNFLWHMTHDDIDEFEDFKTKIYKEFLNI